MEAHIRGPRGRYGAGALGRWAAVSAVVLAAGLDARAAAIHRHGAEPAAAHVGAMPAAELPVFKEWSRYLAGGPATWTRVEHPPYTAAVRASVRSSLASVAKAQTATATPMISYLLWKRSLDPTRFARYHPALAPGLRRIAHARSSPVLTTPSTPTQSSGNSGGSSSSSNSGGGNSTPLPPPQGAQNLVPPTVPEPGMLLLASVMTAWAFRWVRRRNA